MEDAPDYYQLLHVQPDAPAEVIKVSFRTIMLALDQHPDRGGDHEYAARLNEAYHVLIDEERRQRYDLELAARRTGGAAGSRRPAPRPSTGERIRCTLCPFCRAPSWEPPGSSFCGQCGSPLGNAVASDRLEGYGRSAGRLPRDESLTYFTGWPGKAQSGRLDNLSPGGMRFLGNAGATPGQLVKVDRPPLRATGRVIYCHPAEEPGFSFAIGIDLTAVAFDREE